MLNATRQGVCTLIRTYPGCLRIVCVVSQALFYTRICLGELVLGYKYWLFGAALGCDILENSQSYGIYGPDNCSLGA